jgi:hypothetical protein
MGVSRLEPILEKFRNGGLPFGANFAKNLVMEGVNLK